MTITSNTLVRNGMPFIGKVLKQVAPFMDHMVICISESSNDGTEVEIKEQLKGYENKIIWMTENVKTKGELTEVENEMVRRSPDEWVLFLSDDDYWPADQLKECLIEIEEGSPTVYAYSVAPYQLIDLEHYDASWDKKSFSKFLRNEDLNFKGPWPKDMPFTGNVSLYHGHSPQIVKKLPYRFYHLSYMKETSFRKEDWVPDRWRLKFGQAVKMPHFVEL